MIRFISLNAFIAIYTIILSIWVFLLAIFDRSGRIVHFYCAVPWAKGILWVCGVKVIVKGLNNVDRNIPRIYMTNHQSYFDILAVLACLPVDFKFILKQELMKIPILGFCLRRVRMRPSQCRLKRSSRMPCSQLKPRAKLPVLRSWLRKTVK